ncbi:ACT domain-containing protein ACR3-like isoform X2 [Nymphaea colorata]|uniref:ACT domain-containing protein ACR3-like isoform X2 n=2 Tax=Nymphaea colorata TaxID=210225 RepID=UPI00129D665B|nr:ACT domain-containing protein ACR3-like isoform X2 [Nymphaea colorata]
MCRGGKSGKERREAACMGSICWPYFDPEYDTLSQRINPPRVSIDNATCGDCTLVKVDSVNKPGILLEVVQVLTDLDLVISKAYISSDGGWFMDVFHVTDKKGNKVTESKTIEQIEKALGANGSLNTLGLQALQGEYTAFELMGNDRPGLLSEISAVLTQNHCNVAAAEVWTHKTRVACIIYVTDGATSGRVDDPARLADIESQLRNVLRGRNGSAWTSIVTDLTHADRRLHQIMSCASAGGDVDVPEEACHVEVPRPQITVENCNKYSVVNVKCKDRPKLVFDTVYALTEMKCSVFHASVAMDGPYAVQEYYIRHMDGCTLDTEAAKKQVINGLEAAILRRVSDCVSLELSGRDRIGLLSEVTRVLRENGLSVMRAKVTTGGGKAVNVFYVQDTSGNPVDMKTIESLRREMGQNMMFNVKSASDSDRPQQPVRTTKFSFSFGCILEKLLSIMY